MHFDEIGLEPFAEAETLTAVASKISLEADGDALTDQKLTIEVV